MSNQNMSRLFFIRLIRSFSTTFHPWISTPQMMIRRTLPSAISLLVERSTVPIVALTAHPTVLIFVLPAHPRDPLFVLQGHPTAPIFILPVHSTVHIMVSTLHHERRSLQISCNKILRWIHGKPLLRCFHPCGSIRCACGSNRFALKTC